MGMAASQARYLALVARKSNCEYEGQQINQARLNLSNQSANLFNQMLGLSVPVPPSVQDYTKAQYSFTDGINEAVIDKWEQLATPDDNGYNYMVEYHYEANVYKGFEKKMNDPQIQFAYSLPSSDPTAMANAVNAIHNAQVEIANAEDVYKDAKEKYENWKLKASQMATYRDAESFRNLAQITDHTNNGYRVFENSDKSGDAAGATQFYSYNLAGVDKATVKEASLWADSNGNVYAECQYDTNGDPTTSAIAPGTTLYVNSNNRLSSIPSSSYTELTPAEYDEYLKYNNGVLYITPSQSAANVSYGGSAIKTQLDSYLQQWADMGVVVDRSQVYYSLDSNNNIEYIALKDDLDSLSGVGQGFMKTLYVYNPTGNHTTDDPFQSFESANDRLAELKTAAENAYADLVNKQNAFKAMDVPTYVGNTALTSLGELTPEQLAEIKQIISDMTASGADCDFTRCFTSSLNLEINDYIGGIYSFVRDGVTYYTTYYDLTTTANNSRFRNDIDNQPKLDYYYATYVKDNIETVSKAVLDTDSRGRFKSVRFEDSGATFTLNFEQITDDEAYQDAMNQYYYKNAQYDKMVQDINAKTSIIQQQDQELELRLKQLDTEQNALSNEIDAVSKVVKDNVESSFKTFGG